jgi:hypothetical protein
MKKIIILSVLCVFLASMICYFFLNRNTYNILTVNQETIDAITERFDNNALTKYDKRTMRRIYGNMLFFGGFVYPEASKILQHYIFGDGKDLELVSNYFFESDTIKNALDNNRNSTLIGPITLRINEDPRIAYAINGFYIKTSSPMEIYQKINFADRNDKNTYTQFNLFIREIKIPDRLVRTFEADGGCREFTVRIKNTHNDYSLDQ